MKIGILLGSIRKGRKSLMVGSRLIEEGKQFEKAEFELIDIKNYNLPIMPKKLSEYDGSEPEYDDLMSLQQKLNEQDGFIFIVPEYNHGITAALKNVLDYYYTEFNNKALGIVSYGLDGGVRAAEQVRLIAGELRMADVRTHPTLNLFTEFKDDQFVPLPFNIKRIHTLFEDVTQWSTALSGLRK